MRRFAEFVATRPRSVIAVIIAITAFLGSQLRHLETQVSLRDLTPRNHPFMEIDDRLAILFGADQTAVLAVGVATGDVFTTETLSRIQRLTREIEGIPGVVPSSVLSLASPRVKSIEATADGVRLTPLMPEVPQDAAALRALRTKVFSYPQYVGNLVSQDGRGALVLADFASDASVRDVTRALETLAERARAPGVDVYVGGQSPALAALDDATRQLVPLVLLALGIIACVHFEAFRTKQAIVIPLVTAVLSVVWSAGLMTAFGYRITPWTAVTAILVLSVAAGHSVQILKRYYECFWELGDSRAAVITSIARIGPVMLTAGLVASAGFISLASFGVPAVREFGLIAAVGILSALIIELTFIPACRVLLPAPRAREQQRERSHGVVDSVLFATVRAVSARPNWVVIAVGSAVVAAGTGILKLEVNTSFRSWFLADAPVIVADLAIREHFTGTSTIRILVEGDSAEAMVDPAVMQGIASLQATLEDDPKVSATLSVAGYLSMLNRALNGDDPSAYRVPSEKAAVAQYLLVFGSEDLERVLTPDARAAAIYALSRSDDVAWTADLFQRLESVAAREFPANVSVEIAGGELAQALAMNSTVVQEKLENILQVGAVIFVLSSLVFRSIVGGLLVLAPLCCAAIVNMGLMGWFGTWLSFATATYTSMGVSLGADFAIYLLFRVREEGRGGASFREAVRTALLTSGRAIFFVASAIAAGYATLVASGFVPWRQLGVYVSLMMASSAVATVTLVPALLLLHPPRFLAASAGRENRKERAA